jgi:para-nitrobenzyl esterase
MSYWAQFAYTGDPGRGRSGTLEAWKAWDSSSPSAPKFMVLDTHEGGGIRMSAETVDTPTLLAQIATDDRFESPRERCNLYYQLARRGRTISEEEYATVGDGACRDFPFESYPWSD